MISKGPVKRKLHSFLNEKAIDLDFKEKNKAKLIAKLVELLSKSGKLKNKNAFLRSILERERLGSTGIGNGVAIPHAKAGSIKGFALAFAKSREGVDFGALDGEKVYLFFILASPVEPVGEHLKILAKISYLIKDKFIVDLLRQAKDAKEVIRIIRSHENPRK
ncbi:MAG: PTS sugar transporter subunit IIA [Candidatus Omnitrophica bacterium]|nr:PTS sugar transporter subunit IIA [Candidatus Omnitrophota bacterium]